MNANKLKTRVDCVVCPSCGDIIYSRHRNDFRSCSCGEIAVDGGFDYFKICFKLIRPKAVIQYLNATRQELYDDWNTGKNKFGVIKALTYKVKSSKVE